AADRLPERGAVVEVVRDDGSVSLGGIERLLRDRGGRVGKRAEDAAAVQPANAHREDPVPVDLARTKLRGSRTATVRAAEGAAHAEAALGEVQPVAGDAADAVEGHPDDVRGVDASGQHQILDESADGVVDEGGDDRRRQAEATAKASRDVVLSA